MNGKARSIARGNRGSLRSDPFDLDGTRAEVATASSHAPGMGARPAVDCAHHRHFGAGRGSTRGVLRFNFAPQSVILVTQIFDLALQVFVEDNRWRRFPSCIPTSGSTEGEERQSYQTAADDACCCAHGGNLHRERTERQKEGRARCGEDHGRGQAKGETRRRSKE